MKILLVMDQYDSANNGTTISGMRFAQGLRDHGNQVQVVATGPAAPEKYPVPTIRLLPIVKGIVSKQGMCFGWPDRKVLREAISQAEVVHFMMPFPLSQVGLGIAEELGVPHTAAFHVQPENITYTIGLGNNDWVNTAIYRYFRDHFYNRIGHIHCPSAFIADQLRKNGYTADLHVISNGIDPAFVYRKRPKPDAWRDRFVILMVGRLSNEKRQDVLIDAVARSRHAERIQLVLAGQGPKEGKYRQLAAKLAHPIQIGFYDKPDLMDLLAATDLYVHASDAEIEAISCMEAFASGLVPIIANSPKSATPQFAIDERSLFAAGDSQDLANKIDYWIEHPEPRAQMERAYAERGKQYQLSASILKAEDMFRQAMAEPPKRSA